VMSNQILKVSPSVVKLETPTGAARPISPSQPKRRFFPKAVKRPDSAPAAPVSPKSEGGEGVTSARRQQNWSQREYKSFHQQAFEASGGSGGLAPVLESNRPISSVLRSKDENEQEPPPPPLHTLREQTKNFPTTLPISVNQAEPGAHLEGDTACFIDSGSEELKEDTLFLIQLPAALPLPYDPKATRDKPPEEVKTSLMGYPPGQCGKMVVYKSGKIKLRLGNCLMDVSLAKSGTFAQNLMAVNPTDDRCYFLGDVSHTMVVSPSLVDLSIPTSRTTQNPNPSPAPMQTSSPDPSSQPMQT